MRKYARMDNDAWLLRCRSWLPPGARRAALAALWLVSACAVGIPLDRLHSAALAATPPRHGASSLAPTQKLPPGNLGQVAAGLHGLFLHDSCTGEFAPQPDTCLHTQRHERSVAFGGKSGTIYDVTLRVRGIFEPTVIEGGETPYQNHPYFKVGGNLRTRDWSHWHIEVSEPPQTYSLNHYPKVSHTIYKVDFEATIAVAAGATVVIRVIDGNDRQIDNGEKGLPDRQQIIEGVVDTPLAGQMVRLDVSRVQAR